MDCGGLFARVLINSGSIQKKIASTSVSVFTDSYGK